MDDLIQAATQAREKILFPIFQVCRRRRGANRQWRNFWRLQY